LRIALALPLSFVGELGRSLALLGEAEALAQVLDDGARLGWVLTQMTRVRRLTGDPDGAIAAGQPAPARPTPLGAGGLQVLGASFNLGQVYHAVGDFGRAAELWRRIIEATSRESDTPSTFRRLASQAWLAWTLSALGAFAEGRRHGEEALRLATLEGLGIVPMVVHGYLGLLY